MIDKTEQEDAAVRILERLLKNAEEDRKPFMDTYRELVSYCRNGYSERFYQEYMADAHLGAQVSKSSEALDIFGSALYNQRPDRTVSRKRASSPAAQGRAESMEAYLNTIPGETNAHWHNRHSINSGILSGLGILRTALDKKGLVCSRRVKPEDFFRDPDFDVPEEVSWNAVRRRSRRFSLIKRFPHEKARLKAVKSYTGTRSDKDLIQKDGQKDGQSAAPDIDATHDLVEYYEFYFMHGLGNYRGSLRTAGSNDDEDTLSQEAVKLEDGPRKYILVCDPEKSSGTGGGFLIRAEVEEEVEQQLELPDAKPKKPKKKIELSHEWEIPFYKDGKFPFECLELLDDIDGHHPVSPLKAGIGWQRALNYLYTLMLGKARFTLRDVFVVLDQPGIELDQGAIDKLVDGTDIAILRADAKNSSGGAVKAADFFQHIPFPEIKDTALKLIDLCERQHAKATGLYEILYTGETGRQIRSAAEVEMRERSSRSRLSEMEARVETFLSDTSRKEAFAARYLVDPEDVEPVIGKELAAKWGSLRTEDEIKAKRNEVLQQIMVERRDMQQKMAMMRPQAMQMAMQMDMPPQDAQMAIQQQEQQAMAPFEPDAMRARVQQEIDQFGVNFGEWIFEHDIEIVHGSARVKNKDYMIDSNEKMMQTVLPAVIDRMPEVAIAILRRNAELNGDPSLVAAYDEFAAKLAAAPPAPAPPQPGAPPAPGPQMN
jgi:hypothetical protein